MRVLVQCESGLGPSTGLESRSAGLSPQASIWTAMHGREVLIQLLCRHCRLGADRITSDIHTRQLGS